MRYERFNPPISVNDIVEYLEALQVHAKPYLEDDCEGIEVRVQCFDGDYQFHWGDPSFDTDHRGIWGYGFITLDMDIEDLTYVAEGMYDDLIQCDIAVP